MMDDMIPKNITIIMVNSYYLEICGQRSITRGF